MRIFFVEQGRTRVYGEAYSMYVAAGNPRRTQFNGKKTIYGRTLICVPNDLGIKLYRLDIIFDADSFVGAVDSFDIFFYKA